jgi:fructose-bisphosphate aldolase, class II
MSCVNLKAVLDHAEAKSCAIAGFVVLGYEDAKAYIEAAEATNTPIILQAGPGARAHMPVAIYGKMFRVLAETASIPIVCHLDHATTAQECVEALDCGFTSVMIDGSKLDLQQNINLTRQIVDIASKYDATVEGEIGLVGYAGDKSFSLTAVSDAEAFAHDSGVDAMAISIGNIHLNTSTTTVIDYQRLAEIEAVTNLPLVLHGASGISAADRKRLYTEHRVRKFNLGTELRTVFGKALRQSLSDQPQEFDRLKLLKPVIPALRIAAEKIIRELKPAAGA